MLTSTFRQWILYMLKCCGFQCLGRWISYILCILWISIFSRRHNHLSGLRGLCGFQYLGRPNTAYSSAAVTVSSLRPNCFSQTAAEVALQWNMCIGICRNLYAIQPGDEYDGCNVQGVVTHSLLACRPQHALNVLQKVQNAAARLICQLRPNVQNQQYCGQAPKYITDLVSTVAATATRSGLRSENTTNYCLPRL